MATATKPKTTKPKTTQRKAPAKASPRAKSPTAGRKAGGDGAERAAELTGDVLEQLKNGGNEALEAVRDFVNKVDQALGNEKDPSRARDVIDSALEMSQKIVQKEYDALRKIVDSAGKSAKQSRR
jgi:hypothetical protein